MGKGYCDQCGGTFTDKSRPGCDNCAAYKQSIGTVLTTIAEGPLDPGPGSERLQKAAADFLRSEKP